MATARTAAGSVDFHEEVLRGAPTSELADRLRVYFGAEAGSHVPPTGTQHVPLPRVDRCARIACRAVLLRDLDPAESLRIFVDTLLRYTDHPPFVRLVVVDVATRYAVSVDQARVVVELARAVPNDKLLSGDKALEVLGSSQTFIDAGAPATRARPSDPSLLSSVSHFTALLLLQHGESPDEIDGSCKVLGKWCRYCYDNQAARVDPSIWATLQALVWFSDLPRAKLRQAVHNGIAQHTETWVQRGKNSRYLTTAALVARVEQHIDLRDTLRSLVDFRRRSALDREFAESPLRRLPLHIAVQCLEFIVKPAAAKPWVNAWYRT